MLALLQTTDLANIKINELCEQAHVGRVSFYRNFTSKQDILEKEASRLFGSYLEESQVANSPLKDAPLSEQLRAMFEHLQDHSGFYSTLHKQQQLGIIKKLLLERFDANADLPPELIYAGAFVTYTLYGWIEIWLARGMKESPAKIAEMFAAQGL